MDDYPWRTYGGWSYSGWLRLDSCPPQTNISSSLDFPIVTMRAMSAHIHAHTHVHT